MKQITPTAWLTIAAIATVIIHRHRPTIGTTPQTTCHYQKKFIPLPHQSNSKPHTTMKKRYKPHQHPSPIPTHTPVTLTIPQLTKAQEKQAILYTSKFNFSKLIEKYL